MNMKRVFALVLMALLLCLPVWVMAAEVASGTNGTNVHWSLDNEGTLTISGTGDMAGRYNLGYWEDYKYDVKKIVIGDGITGVGKEQFRFHNNLQSVVIGKDVISIGEYAFNDCTALKSVIFKSDTINSIGEWAFYGCSSLRSICLPKGLTTIENNTFARSGLTSMVIPDGVKTIDYSAFYDCESLVSVTIPDGMKSIGMSAFFICSSLTSITIPSSVESIGDSAFEYCTNLQTANIPCSWHENPLYDFEESVTLVFPGEWSEWTVVKPATTTETGKEQRVCTVCGHVLETREIPMLPAPPIENPTDLPKTGDESNVLLWSALACISVISMMTLVRKKKEA